jgi:hypothetical protein
MALFEDFTLGSVTSSALVGLGLVVAAPVLFPVVGAVIRPVMRLAIKGSIAAYDTAAALVTTAGEEFNQLMAEARAELTPVPVSDAMSPAEDIAPHILRPDEASA